ncbi:ABC transporter ATP-binding protein [Candidatus Hodarchaeum mangrovi]
MRQVIFSDVSVRYRRTSEEQISNVNLKINEGQLILLCGPSGSGKSTLTLLFNGIIPHHSRALVKGEINIFGRNPLKEKVANMANMVGMLLQDPESQLATSRVKDEIILTLEFQGKPRDEIDVIMTHILKRFELEKLAEADSIRLSGGEKQLVALAAMLSLDPDIIILDEPTSNLDPLNTRKVLNHVASFKKEGKTIILIEHKINEVFNCCPPDKIIIMNNGIIYDQGMPEDIVQRGSLQKIGLKLPKIYDYCSRLSLTPNQRKILPFSLIDFQNFIKSLSSNQKTELANFLEFSPRMNLKTNQNLMEFSNISFIYRNQLDNALKDVTFSINKGEFIAIVGNNGSGKSTLVKHMIGLNKPKDGNLVIDGKNSKHWTAAKLARKVAFLFQNPDYQIFNSTVLNEVSYGAKNCGMKKLLAIEKAKESLNLVNLNNFVEKDPLRLSMGQKQRVAVASALTMNPEVYVLDEPTTGQDPTSLKGIMDLMLMEYQRSSATIVLVTHDMELVDSVANRVLAMNDGTIVLDDLTDNVFANPLLTKCNLEPPIRMKIQQILNESI